MKSDGVTHYTKARVEFDIFFPNDLTSCFYCPLCIRDTVGRDKCSLTREIIPFSHTERGQNCPAVIKEG